MELLKESKPFFGIVGSHNVHNAHSHSLGHGLGQTSTGSSAQISQLENNLQFCTSQLHLFSNELKLLLAQIEIISQFIHAKFGIELFNRESVLLHHSHDFCEIEEITELIQTTTSFNVKPAHSSSDFSDDGPGSTNNKNNSSTSTLASTQPDSLTKKKRRKKPTNANKNPMGNSVSGFNHNSQNQNHNHSPCTGDPAKMHSCRFCGKMYNKQRYVTQHERTHTDKRPFPCHLCPKSFKLKQHLTCHIRTHTGERPYTCNICNKSFTQSKSLRIHAKQHEYSNKYVPPSESTSKNQSQRKLSGKTENSALKTEGPGLSSASGSISNSNKIQSKESQAQSTNSNTIPNPNPRQSLIQNPNQLIPVAGDHSSHNLNVNVVGVNVNTAPPAHAHLHQQQQQQHSSQNQHQNQNQPLNFNINTSSGTVSTSSSGSGSGPNSGSGNGNVSGIQQQQHIHDESQNQNHQLHPWNLNTVPLFPLSSQLSNLRGVGVPPASPSVLTSYASNYSGGGGGGGPGTAGGGAGSGGNNNNLVSSATQFGYHQQGNK